MTASCPKVILTEEVRRAIPGFQVERYGSDIAETLWRSALAEANRAKASDDGWRVGCALLVEGRLPNIFTGHRVVNELFQLPAEAHALHRVRRVRAMPRLACAMCVAFSDGKENEAVPVEFDALALIAMREMATPRSFIYLPQEEGDLTCLVPKLIKRHP